jgi:hypothetical protein
MLTDHTRGSRGCRKPLLPLQRRGAWPYGAAGATDRARDTNDRQVCWLAATPCL